MVKQRFQAKRTRYGSQSSASGRHSEEEVSLVDKIEKLRESHSSSLSNVQFIVTTMSIAVAVYLITKSLPVGPRQKQYIQEEVRTLTGYLQRETEY